LGRGGKKKESDRSTDVTFEVNLLVKKGKGKKKNSGRVHQTPARDGGRDEGKPAWLGAQQAERSQNEREAETSESETVTSPDEKGGKKVVEISVD